MLMRGIAVPAVWAGIHYLNKHGVEGVTRRAEHVPSRDGRRTIKVHIYEREETQGEKKAVLINFHGSGFGEFVCWTHRCGSLELMRSSQSSMDLEQMMSFALGLL